MGTPEREHTFSNRVELERKKREMQQKRGGGVMPGRKKEEPMDQSGNVKKQQTNVQINQGQFNSGKQLEIERPEHDEEAAGGQSRLFVGGLPQGVATDQVRGLFKQYGDVKDVYIPAGKAFAFVKMACRAEADSAKSSLRGCKIKGQPRPIRIKFANQGTSIEVKNLAPHISNERLYDGFVRFGKIERSVVLVDEKGKSLERGIIEFDRKSSATRAIEQVNNGCFFLTKSPRAIVAAQIEAEDADDGLREEQLYNVRDFQEEYSFPPRFAAPETYEMDFGNRWKALEELERSQMEQVKGESIERKKRLEQEMAVGVAQEHERLMRREIERQRNEVKRMEEQRLARTNMLRTRHDMEMEGQRQNRAKITEQHNSLRSVIDGNNMKAADEYKAPPNWKPPPQHHHEGGWGPEQRHGGGGGDQWHDQGGYSDFHANRPFDGPNGQPYDDYHHHQAPPPHHNHSGHHEQNNPNHNNRPNQPRGGGTPRGGGGGTPRGAPRGHHHHRGGGQRRGPY